MNQALLDQNQLKEWSQCGHLSKLEKWLKENGIKYFKNGKGEIVSTVEACNSALLSKKHEEIEF